MDVDTYTFTADRVVATTAAIVALAGVIIGGLALARRPGRGRPWRPMTAMVAGLIGLVLGGFVVATADGGPGTGNGIVGGYAALVLGLTAAVLGSLATARARRAA